MNGEQITLEGELSDAAIEYLAALVIELYRIEQPAPAESPRGEVLAAFLIAQLDEPLDPAAVSSLTTTGST